MDNWDCFVERDRTPEDPDSDDEVDAVLPQTRSVVGILAAAAAVGIVASVVHRTKYGYCDEVTVRPPQHHGQRKATRTNFPWFFGYESSFSVCRGCSIRRNDGGSKQLDDYTCWYVTCVYSNPGFELDLSEASGTMSYIYI
jgi:hypothetical protein